MKTLFNELTYRLMDERLHIVEQGGIPPAIPLHSFFYECRNKFLKEHPERNEVDGKEDDKVGMHEHAVIYWCERYCEKHGWDKGMYWRAREMLNIWAKGKATCEGEVDKFLVDHRTRDRITRKCSFILICEKETITDELLEKLRGERYHLNIISTGGQNPSDVQEAVLSAMENVDDDDPTFYILSLHDYDLAGLEIYFNLKRRHKNIIDIGVNQDFIKWWKAGEEKAKREIDFRLVEEQVKNKNYHGDLEGYIKNDDDYTDEDFDYLQYGIKKEDSKKIRKKKKESKPWKGQRIEIDAIHVAYGIEPFVQYTIKKLQECRLWDLSRIGVEDFVVQEPEEFSLNEPTNLFEGVLSEFDEKVKDVVSNAYYRERKVLDNIIDIVTDEFELWHQKSTVLQIEFSVDEDGLYNNKCVEFKQKYKDGFDRTYKDSYEETLKELNKKLDKFWVDITENELEKINDQITHYEGDVREGEDDLKAQRDELQKQVDDTRDATETLCDELQEKINSAAKNDPELQEFKSELDKVDWGKEKFEQLKAPDEKDVLECIIERLQERLEELEK